MESFVQPSAPFAGFPGGTGNVKTNGSGKEQVQSVDDTDKSRLPEHGYPDPA